MTKVKSIILISVLLTAQLVGQSPDTIKVKLSRVKGFGPFEIVFSSSKGMSKNNPWKSAVPTYKNIPDSLKELMISIEEADFLQHTYQSYYTNKISSERFEELKAAWNWNPTPLEYTRDFTKVHVGIVAGYDSNGILKIKIDRNNNYDFSDDNFFTLPSIIPGQKWRSRYNESSIFEVEHELFDGIKKRNANVWFYVDYSPFFYESSKNLSIPIELAYAFAEHHAGEFILGNKKYNVAILSDRAVFRENYNLKLWTDEEFENNSILDRVIQRNGVVKIDKSFYRFIHASIDGSELTLVKDNSVLEKGGNVVGLKALNFKAQSISGAEIELKKLRGKYVLIDFWGTWCAPCREEIPKLKQIYNDYKNKNFEIIGIANDNQKSLKNYVQKNIVLWEQIVQEDDKSIISLYNVVGYPTTFLINKEGIIIEKGIRANEIALILDSLLID